MGDFMLLWGSPCGSGVLDDPWQDPLRTAWIQRPLELPSEAWRCQDVPGGDITILFASIEELFNSSPVATYLRTPLQMFKAH